MAVTLRELLTAAHDELTYATGDPRRTALAAVATFGPLARGLDHLYGTRPFEQYAPEQLPTEVRALEAAARAATACWPHGTGRAGDLVGAAADAVATRSRLFDDRQRWAISVEFAETARRAVDAARRFSPYATVPHLAAVRDAAVAVEQRAAQAPHEADATALDLLLPGPAHSGAGLTAAVDAAAGLQLATALHRPADWRLAEVVITVNAAQLVTGHAAAHAAALPPLPGRHPWHRPSLTAPEAWHTARLLCRPFDDGTKLRPPAGSAVAGAAARLGRTVIDQFGTAPPPGVIAPNAIRDSPERVGTLLTITALLPEVADRLQRAVHSLGATGRLWAAERSLLAYEDHNPAAGPGTHTAAAAESRDLDRLVSTLRVAGALTTALAADLATIAPPRLPELTREHVARTGESKVLSAMALGAHDALRHAHLAVGEEWAVPAAAPGVRAPRPGR